MAKFPGELAYLHVDTHMFLYSTCPMRDDI